MIRNVLLMATSGLVLFSKEFVNAVAQPRLIGSLLYGFFILACMFVILICIHA